MFEISHERLEDVQEREALLDRVMGPGRWAKPSQRLRDGRSPAQGLSFVARAADGRLVGTVRLWEVVAGSAGPALLLGPLAIDGAWQGCGVGRALMARAASEAAARGYRAILLVGDAPYYARFGYSAAPTAGLELGPEVDPARFLALELTPGALDGACGQVLAAGRRVGAKAVQQPVSLRPALAA